jgi:hypothetical protein
MSNMKTLPKSPEEMPASFHNGDDEALRNCLVTLDQFRTVDIHWEMDVASTNREGEPVGEWEVVIESRARRFKAKHAYITNALWFAYTLADAADTEEFQQREAAHKAALEKLSPEEQQILGLSIKQ